MNIISHRGYWKSPVEKNQKIAFERSFDLGFGTETDIRDYNGDLVISHDIPNKKSMKLEDFLVIVEKYSNEQISLALNIKLNNFYFGSFTDFLYFSFSTLTTKI